MRRRDPSGLVVGLLIDVVGLDGARRRVKLGRGAHTIGASDESDLTLPGPGVRAVHARVRVRHGAWTLINVEGAPVYVDHARLPDDAPYSMHAGSRAFIGLHRLDIVHAAPHRSYRRPLLAAIPAALALFTVAAYLMTRPPPRESAAQGTDDPDRRHAPQELADVPPAGASTPRPPAARRTTTTVRHRVLPGETIPSIATRYNVDLRRLIHDNRLNPDLPLQPGTDLTLDAVDPPLPRQRLTITVEPGATWGALSERYGLTIAELRAQSPGMGNALVAGAELDLWVEPQIERRAGRAHDVSFPLAAAGMSLGSPTHGTLQDGVQLPQSPLYVRRNPALMFGSRSTIAQLQTAIYRFRRVYRYTGDLVIADLSRETGGPRPPHHSHQSGRDVDIWLPTLRGAYDHRYLREDRRPHPDEVNWLAAWGLVESLLASEGVRYIFLNSALQERLYRAGETMGASAAELAQIQWQPEGQPRTMNAPIRHARGHTGHIHVRFKCAEDEDRCARNPSVEADP